MHDAAMKGRFSEGKKKLWLRPGYKEQMSIAFKEVWKLPEYARKMSKKRKAAWKDEEHRDNLLRCRQDPKARSEHSKAVKLAWKAGKYDHVVWKSNTRDPKTGRFV